MLATRAATNPDLKALMKVVASSKATQEQLKLFQSHIDELNNMLRQQDHEQELERMRSVPLHGSLGAEPDSDMPKLSQVDGPSDRPSEKGHALHSSSTGAPPSLAFVHPTHSGHRLQSQQVPEGNPQASIPARTLSPFGPYPPPQQKLSMLEAHIKAIILEFTSPTSSTVPPCQDRYVFPEYAVLDTPLSGQGLEMVCSFFVLRRGSDLLAMQAAHQETAAGSSVGRATYYKTDEEYYQLVTMTIKTTQHRTLETIARAARPLIEVQGKMRETMRSCIRVKDEYLALRLPRDTMPGSEAGTGRDGGFTDSAVEMDDDAAVSVQEEDELKPFYGIWLDLDILHDVFDGHTLHDCLWGLILLPPSINFPDQYVECDRESAVFTFPAVLHSC
jgi:hypothetical protein